MSASVLTVLVLAILQVVKGNGVVEIKAVRYSSSCQDNWILKTQCDTFFEFCLKLFTSPSDSLSQCDLGSYGPTNHYDDRNYIDFTYVTSFPGGIKNPLKFEVRKFESFDLKFVIRVRDDEAQGSEHLAWLTKVFSHRPAAMEQQSVWSSVLTASSGSYQFLFQFRSYCTANFYTSACNVYCVAQDNASGHYTCDQTTGAKVCMPGWTGEACTTDVDECAQGICHNGANCTNLPGSYTCDCPENFVGKKCDLIYSLCYSKPCFNGGSCLGNTTYYSCSCGANWTGDACQTMVNFCKSSPCLNGATCVPIVGSHSCVCAKGWMGSNCETEVNACLSSPCINNGTCYQAAGGEYTCKCTADYEGSHCEKYLDPCLSSPCHNSGTCIRLNQDKFNCTCPVDFQGTVCSQYVDLCETFPCQNAGTCTRLAHDDFRCSCTVDYGGRTCEEYKDPCHSRPCLNGATCTRLTHDKYECSCPVDYTGRECQDYVDLCTSLPCYNLGSCVRVTHHVFRCNCTEDYTGRVCEEFVDPCRSLPCLHSGTCTRQAFDEYTCNCTEDYTGSGCEEYVDPCLAGPCHNSATCVREDFTTYTCVCSAGYIGINCSQPVGQVGNHAASLQDSKNDNPLPIILAICGSFLIAIIIVAVFLIVRRRRKKSKFPDTVHVNIREVHNGNDPTVAFDNDLYRHVNMANASLEDSRREKQDLPPSSPENFINPTTTSAQLLLVDEERGAVGGVDHPYQDIDCCKLTSGKGSGSDKGKETNLKQMSADGNGKDACLQAGPSDTEEDRAKANPYEDFEELKRLSRVQRSREEFANNSYNLGDPGLPVQMENPYHDLDEVRQEVEAMQQQILDNIRGESRFPPLPPPPPPVTPRAIILQTEGYSDLAIDDKDDSSEDEAGEQEDIHQLRQEVMRARHLDGPPTASKC